MDVNQITTGVYYFDLLGKCICVHTFEKLEVFSI